MNAFRAAATIVEVEVAADGQGKIVDVLVGDPALRATTRWLGNNDCNPPAVAGAHPARPITTPGVGGAR